MASSDGGPAPDHGLGDARQELIPSAFSRVPRVDGELPHHRVKRPQACRPKINTVLAPPNAKWFDMATSIGTFRATLGT